MASYPCSPLELDQQIWQGAVLHTRLTGSAWLTLALPAGPSCWAKMLLRNTNDCSSQITTEH